MSKSTPTNEAASPKAQKQVPAFIREVLRHRDEAVAKRDCKTRSMTRWQRYHEDAAKRLVDWRELTPGSIKLWEEAQVCARRATKALHDCAFYCQEIVQGFEELAQDCVDRKDLSRQEAVKRLSSAPKANDSNSAYERHANNVQNAVGAAVEARRKALSKDSRNALMTVS